MKIQVSMTPQKINNHTVKDLVDSDGDEISIYDLKDDMKD
jgi:hypothetical protein